jgi:hypothetical protein
MTFAVVLAAAMGGLLALVNRAGRTSDRATAVPPFV